MKHPGTLIIEANTRSSVLTALADGPMTTDELWERGCTVAPTRAALYRVLEQLRTQGKVLAVRRYTGKQGCPPRVYSLP